MTKSAQYLGKLAYENNAKLERNLRSLLRKVKRKIELYDYTIEIYSSRINLEYPGIEFTFLSSVYRDCEDPFPNAKKVKIRYPQDPAYIADVVRDAAMIKRYPKIILDVKIKWTYKDDLNAFKVIVPLEAYKDL